MNAVISSPFFGIFITIACYEFCFYLKRWIKSSLFNPVLFTTVLVIIILSLLNISYTTYNQSASFLSSLLLPATSVLAVHIYRQRKILKIYWFPILAGCVSGALTSMLSIILLSKIFKLDEIIAKSLLPKSITTAIAIDVSLSLEGVVSITIVSVIITGMIGAIFAPVFIKLFKLDDPIAQGCAIGCASHALGTTKAVELGEVQTAIASVAIIITGISTVLISILLKIVL